MSDFQATQISANKLPVIDVSGLSSSKPEDRAAVGAAIRAACIDNGFFYVSDHGIPQGLIDAVQAQTKALFDLPIEQKRKVSKALSSCNRGWEPLEAQSLDLDAPPDLKETFYMGLELPLDHPAVVAGKFNCGPNIWPADMLEFKPTMRGYHAAMRDLGERLMVGLALSLDLPENYFDDLNRDPLSTLRLLHYPPHPADAKAGQAGAGAHTDYGVLTLLLQDANGGLQVKDSDDSWIHAPPIAGTFIVNIGDAIARWTNDIYRSTVHRVVNVSGNRRYSVPFFYSGNADHPIKCLPNCLKPGETPKYEEATIAEHMMQMYQKSYGAAANKKDAA
jgi:isopenicillin N synthase-like dioxygenase